jgi:hypothetical protein
MKKSGMGLTARPRGPDASSEGHAPAREACADSRVERWPGLVADVQSHERSPEEVIGARRQHTDELAEAWVVEASLQPHAARGAGRVHDARDRAEARLDPQELVHGADGPRGIGAEVVVDDDPDLAVPEQSQVALDVRRVVGEPGVLQRARPPRVRREAAPPTSIRLGCHGRLEVPDVLPRREQEQPMQRVHHLHRAAEHDDDLRLGAEVADLLCRGCTVEVPDRGLAHAPLAVGRLEEPQVAGHVHGRRPRRQVVAEEVRLLPIRHEHIGMLLKRGVEGGGAAARRADDEEVRTRHRREGRTLRGGGLVVMLSSLPPVARPRNACSAEV